MNTETMFLKPFRTSKVVSKTVFEPFTIEQLDEILKVEKPKEIYHRQWGSIPFLVITEYNIEGFKMYCNGAADKTPKQHTAASLHKFMKYQGLEDCYIKVVTP